nr:hypothetical protein [Actinomycetota bacterium]
VEALVLLPVSAPAVVAPPMLEEIAGRSIALPTDEVIAMAVAPRLTERVGPGLSTARVLPKAGDPSPQPNGVWLPLVLTVAALGFGVLGVVWPRQRRRPTPYP